MKDMTKFELSIAIIELQFEGQSKWKKSLELSSIERCGLKKKELQIIYNNLLFEKNIKIY